MGVAVEHAHGEPALRHEAGRREPREPRTDDERIEIAAMEPSFLGLEPTVPWQNGGMRLCNVRVVGALRSRQLWGGGR